MNRTVSPLMIALLAGVAWAGEKPGGGTSVTIYSSAAPGAIPPEMYRPTPGAAYSYAYQYRQPGVVPGFGIVRVDRPITLGGAVSEVKFTDVAALIDPTTVSFTCLTDPGTVVLEQNYQFDLVSNEKLLERFIDREVTATVIRGDHSETITGVLLSSSPGGLILKTRDGLELVNGYSGLSFASLPEGLITRPTLVWKVKSPAPGSQTARVSYETQGMTWWADYNLLYADGKDENSGTLTVGAWVSILNQSGASYGDATLKLVAGEVNRAPRGQNEQFLGMARSSTARDDGGVAGFQEKSFFEYHLYTLGRPSTLPDNSTKQIELFPTAANVPCTKVIVYDGFGGEWWWGGTDPYTDAGPGTPTKKDVDVYVKFRNDAASGMGMPLPAGRIRMSKVDPADGGVEFIGEDVIRHTPKDEDVLVKVGKAFDLVGERVVKNFEVDWDRRTMTETIEVKVRNHKAQPVKVLVQERMYRWTGWKIAEKSHDYTKVDSRRVHFPLALKPGEEGVVTYTVVYSW
ncbi:MAG: hypothetical protein HBSAPP03_04770 [Phycisphaerae bacterium]|nr:MAG: hypothetical protein HBSAPP03_04770 [Phycisphaerae bacterium]